MPQTSYHAQHILVFDQDPAILQLFGDLLGDAGYRVTLETFERQACCILERIRTLQPDLVVMELLVDRELRGWELLQSLRQDPATRDIPVVVCTGAIKQIAQIGKHLDSMGVQVVFKPFEIDHMIAAIDSATRARQIPPPVARIESSTAQLA